MTATYPDDATYNTALFSTTSEVTYTDTGPVETTFVLGQTAETEAEILALADSTLQSPSVYTLASNLQAITFTTPPNVSNLTVKTLLVPDRFITRRALPTISTVNFNNTSPITIDSNVYLVNGDMTAWAFPFESSVSSTADFIATISGAVQHSEGSFTFPSATLANNGIDISPAIDNPDTLELRVFDVSRTILDRSNSMIDRRPDRGYTERRKFDTIKWRSQAGYEKRRQRGRRIERGFRLTYTNISGMERQAIRDFYDARIGEFEAFFLDLDHLNQVGTLTVRFDGELDVQNIFDGSSDELRKFYTVTIKLLEVFD